jgi:hypothetical protein
MCVQLGQHRVEVTLTAALLKLDADGAEVGEPADDVSTAQHRQHSKEQCSSLRAKHIPSTRYRRRCLWGAARLGQSQHNMTGMWTMSRTKEGTCSGRKYGNC